MSISASAFVLIIEHVDFFVDNDSVDNDSVDNDSVDNDPVDNDPVDNDSVDLIDIAAAIDTTLIYNNFRLTGELNSKLTTSKNKKTAFFLNSFEGFDSN